MSNRRLRPACLAAPALLLAAAAALAGEATDFAARPEHDLVWLENGRNLRAAISPRHGGELAGFALLHEGRWHELLYRGLDYSDAPGWRGKAPLLWPATGISVTADGSRNQYRLEGEDRGMPFHGFARERAWTLLQAGTQADAAFAVLQMTDDADSRRLYPFGFEMQVTYRLEADRLRIDYRITASTGNARPMPFSIGNHVTFRAPLVGDGDASDVAFETTLPLQLLTGEDKAFDGATRPSPFTGRHRLSELPRRSGVSLGGTPGPAALVIHDPSGLQLSVSHDASSEPPPPVARFTLWADTADGFFSPEPWVGTQNSLNTGLGLILLPPGQQWSWSIVILPSWSPNPAPSLEETAS